MHPQIRALQFLVSRPYDLIPTSGDGIIAKYVIYIDDKELNYNPVVRYSQYGNRMFSIPVDILLNAGYKSGEVNIKFKTLLRTRYDTTYYQIFRESNSYKVDIDPIDDRKTFDASFEVFDIKENSAKFKLNLNGLNLHECKPMLTLNGKSVNITNWFFDDLDDNTEYVYNLVLKKDGYKDFNVSGNFTTKKEIKPNDDLGVFVSDIKEKSARLFVGNINSDSKYEVDFLGKIIELTSNGFPFELSSLSGNTDYTVKVRELINGKIGKWNTANFKTVDVPKPQANILGVTFSDITSTSAKCNVSAENFDKMEIYLDGKLVSSSAPFTFTGLKYGKFYRVRVVVSNSYNSDDSISNFMTKKPDSSGGGGKPPEITGNEDLDKVVDDLDKGTMDLKTAGLIVIFTVITMIVIFFGAYWLFNMWKRWMSMSNGSDMGNALPVDANVKLTQKMTVTSKEGKIVYTKNRKLSNNEINDTLRHFR